MKLKLKIFSALCSAKVFEINDIPADTSDFGESYDASPEEAKRYACGNRVFERIPSTKQILKKYKINQKEYDEIASELEEKLSWGSCGWCV
jgi:hypothetical protein